jgi:hypothetical protein
MSDHPSPVEPPEELARLREDLIAFYQPENSQERLAVERIALAQQSILRAARLETSLFTSPAAEGLHGILETEAFKVFLRYQSQAERAYRRAVQELRQLEGQRPTQPVRIPAKAAPAPAPLRPAGPCVAAAAGASPPAPALTRTAAVASAPIAFPIPGSTRNGKENLALRL